MQSDTMVAPQIIVHQDISDARAASHEFMMDALSRQQNKDFFADRGSLVKIKLQEKILSTLEAIC